MHADELLLSVGRQNCEDADNTVQVSGETRHSSDEGARRLGERALPVLPACEW
jgi:hypothetical protein